VIEVVDEFTIHAKVIAVKWQRNWKELAATLMESLIAAGEKPEKLKRLIRAIKWWIAGDVDDDPLDKFLKFYIAFELLAAAQEYKEKYPNDWVKRFCNDYGITYKINKWRLSDIRNYLVHNPGEEREEAERLAAQHAERFGLELLEAIKKAILQPSPVDASASKNCETENGCGK
jgi:ADP-heptose:LPS heptosyltransferase